MIPSSFVSLPICLALVASVLGGAARPAVALPCVDWATVPQLIQESGAYGRGYARVGNVLYAAHSPGPSPLLVLDISEPEFPVILTSLDVGSLVRDFAISGNVLYVAASSNVFVLDITTPTAPVVVGSLGVPSQSVSSDGTRLYSVNFTSLDVFDISAPLTPALLGSNPTPTEGLCVWQPLAVTVAGPNMVTIEHGQECPFDGGGTNLSLVDATDAANPNFFVGTSLYVGGGEQCPGSGSSVTYGSVAAVSATEATCAPSSVGKFRCFDLTSPDPVAEFSSVSSGTILFWDANTVFWGTDNGTTQGIQEIDVSDPAAPVFGTLHPTAVRNGAPFRVDDYLYLLGEQLTVYDFGAGAAVEVYPGTQPFAAPIGVLDTGENGLAEIAVSGAVAWRLLSGELRTIDISDPAFPGTLGTLSGSGSTPSALAVTSFGVAAAQGQTVQLIDGSVPTAPTVLGSFAHTASVTDVVVIGNVAHLAAIDGYVQLDLSNLAAPVQTDDEPVSSSAHRIQVLGDSAFLLGRTGNDVILHQMDLTPRAKEWNTTLCSTGPAHDMELVNNVLYVLADDLVMYTAFGDGRTESVLLGSLPIADGRSLKVDGDIAYVAAVDRTHVIDVSDRTNPIVLGTYNGDGMNVAIGPDGTVWLGDSRMVSIPPQCTSADVASPVVVASPLGLALSPTPFRGATEVAFHLRSAGPSRLAAFDASGRLVDTLVDRSLPAGAHVIRWRPGRGVSAGVYFLRLKSGARTETRKTVLVR